MNASKSKEETTLTSKYSPPRILIAEDPKSSDFKGQLVSELKFKLQSGEHSQAQGCLSNMFFTSDSLISDSSLAYSLSVSSEDKATSQVLHIHPDNGGISMKQLQEPQVSKYVLWECQDKNFPSAKRGPKARECGSEDLGLGTSKATRKSHLGKDRKLEATSKSLSQKESFRPASYFRKKDETFSSVD